MHSISKKSENLSSDEIDENHSLGLVGLQNLGNTCYMNAVLQVLSHCPPLTDSLLQLPLYIINEPLKLTEAYISLLNKLWSSKSIAVAVPSGVLCAMRSVYPMFRGYSQHDSPEFMRNFLNEIHNELKHPLRKFPPTEVPETTDPLSNGEICRNVPLKETSKMQISEIEAGDAEKPLENLLEEPPSVVTDVFQGATMTGVKCMSCNGVYDRQEVFFDLPLPLAGPHSVHSRTRIKVSATQSGAFSLSTWIRESVTMATASMASKAPLRPCTSKARPRRSDRSKPRSSNKMTLTVSKPVTAVLAVGHRMVAPIFRISFALVMGLFFYLLFALTWMKGCIWSPRTTLHDCIDTYFAEEELTGENKYFCSRCSKRTNGRLHSQIVKLPEVLCLYLKRFRSDSYYSSKLSTAVEFPLRDLDLKTYLHKSCEDKIATFDLIGVVCHSGSVLFGHYYSYAFNRFTERWYEFNDSLVSPVDDSTVAALSSSAYMLIYRKQANAMIQFRDQFYRMFSNIPPQIPTDEIVWISHRWIFRFKNFAEPGPVDNTDFLCAHGSFHPLIWERQSEFVEPIDCKLWVFFVDHFGGGPLVTNLFPCQICYDAIVVLEKRQREEQTAFLKQKLALVSSIRTRKWSHASEDRYLEIPVTVVDSLPHAFTTYENFKSDNEQVSLDDVKLSGAFDGLILPVMENNQLPVNGLDGMSSVKQTMDTDSPHQPANVFITGAVAMQHEEHDEDMTASLDVYPDENVEDDDDPSLNSSLLIPSSSPDNFSPVHCLSPNRAINGDSLHLLAVDASEAYSSTDLFSQVSFSNSNGSCKTSLLADVEMTSGDFISMQTRSNAQATHFSSTQSEINLSKHLDGRGDCVDGSLQNLTRFESSVSTPGSCLNQCLSSSICNHQVGSDCDRESVGNRRKRTLRQMAVVSQQSSANSS